MIFRSLLMFAVCCFLLVVSGCGFRPLYGTSTKDSEVVLSKIFIDIIPDKKGVYLRNILMDRFYTNGVSSNPDYILRLSKIDEENQDFDITVESEATRSQMKLYTDMELLEAKTGRVVLKRRLVATSSHNILDSQFTTRVSEEDAKRANLNDLAKQAELQVSLFLGRCE